MPPYDPPSAHYCEINAFTNPGDNFKLIGPDGHNFKRLTLKLNVEYIWWNIERNVIEIWGPYSKMKYSQEYMNKYMHRFHEKHCQSTAKQVEFNLDVSQAKRLKISN